MFFRFQFYMRIFEQTGLLTELIMQVFKSLIPFFALLMLWNGFFTLEYFILEADKDDVEGYEGL